MSILSTLRVARAPVAAFAAMGVLWGSFAAVLPDIKTMLDIDESRLGLLMFMTPVAAVLSMLVTPFVGAALGRVALPVAALVMCAGFALPGQTASLWLFPLAMMVCGAGTGMTDVLMNARVAALENNPGPHLMSLCHAGYSFGYAGGAIATGAMRADGWSPALVLGSMAVVAAILCLPTFESDGRIDGLKRPKGPGAAHLGLVPVIGGGMVLIAFLTENAAENWSALHIEKTLGAAVGHGSFGPAAMALTMGVARLFGAAVATSAAMAYASFIVMGIGSSVIAPTAFSLVAQLADPKARARAIARATLLGFLGFFFGPPLIGLIAGAFGLRFAFVFAAAMLAAIPILAKIMANHRPRSSATAPPILSPKISP